jgi:predicted RNA binding protein YcfA (HicA-like mRNA interferase family)
LPSSKIVSALKRDGFVFVSQKGSHLKLKKGSRVVIIPMHDEVRRGTLQSILEQAGMSLGNFLTLL